MVATAALPELSSADVARLARDRSPAARGDTATRVAQLFAGGGISAQAREIAVDILERLARDIEVQVRRAVSEQLKSCPFLPAAIARTLAHDVESVAVPMIRCSTVLDDAELIAIIRDGNPAKQIAVAERGQVSAVVSKFLVETRRREVVGTLLANHGAEIPEPSYREVLAEHGDDRTIQNLLIDRPTLPMAVTERLIDRVASALRERLIARHGFPPRMVDAVVDQGRERVLAEQAGGLTLPGEMDFLVQRLKARGALSTTFALRALANGDLHLFEASVACHAGVPSENARRLIHDVGPEGFRRLYRQAGLLPELYPAFRSALDIVLEVRRDRAGDWRAQDTKRIVDTVVRSCPQVAPGDLENVLAQVARRSDATDKPAANSTDAPRDAATAAGA